MLQLNLTILLLTVLPLHPLYGSVLLLIAGEWLLQNMRVAGDEQSLSLLEGPVCLTPCTVCSLF